MKYPQLVSMPSAVSDWLEEQLEARGIESEVYTRYILSLLRAHTLDVIYPEDDLPFSDLKKDGGRSAVTHKRIRRIGTWWRHAHAHAEQIKRSAAVECLMSAAEQSCEIESLVDELCEKLKEVNSEGANSPNKNIQDSKIFKEPLKQKKISPKELAEKYYAAFPPLNHREENSYFSSNIKLVAGKWPSPDKNQIDLIAAKWTTSGGSPKKPKRKPKRQLFEPTMKPTSRTGQGKNRFGHKRSHCGRSLTKEMADNIANWEFVYNNNNYQMQDQCLDSINPATTTCAEDVDMCDIDERDSPICRMNVWLKNTESEQDYKTIKNNNATKRTRLYEKKGKYIPLYPTTIWSDNEEPSNDEWAIIGTKRAPEFTPEQVTPWSLEGEESAIREEYQRPMVTPEVVSAIKDEYNRPFKPYCRNSLVDVNFNEAAVDVNFNEAAVDIKANSLGPSQVNDDIWNFGLATRDDLLQRQDDEFTRQNNENDVLEILRRRQFLASIIRRHYQDEHTCKNVETSHDSVYRDIFPFFDFKGLFNKKTLSLMMVNHDMESSAFSEYTRPVLMNIDGSRPGPFSRPFGRPIKRPRRIPDNAIEPQSQLSDEDKFTSPNMYFEPIKSLPLQKESKDDNTNILQDGTSFNVRSSPDEVKFQRSATGSLLLETEFGEFRKYFEYKWRPPSDESVKLPGPRKLSEGNEFHIKYWVSPNDKACQTEEIAPPVLSSHMVDIEASALQAFQTSVFSKAVEGNRRDELEEDEACEWTTTQSCRGVDEEESERSNSLCEADEFVWGYDSLCKCCNVKNSLSNNSTKKLDIEWDDHTLKNIWGGTETCGTCPWSTKVATPLVETTKKLREECKEEAERLLSDLRSLQLSYSSRVLDDGPSEKKRRHSYMNNDTALWSFATRVQENCLISLPTLPTRRSVTL